MEEFQNQTLRVAIAEVETRSFEHKALKADYGLGMLFENLEMNMSPLEFKKKEVSIVIPLSMQQLTGSSGVNRSDGEPLML